MQGLEHSKGRGKYHMGTGWALWAELCGGDNPAWSNPGGLGGRESPEGFHSWLCCEMNRVHPPDIMGATDAVK